MKLWLHIGTPKTGTTSMQRWFAGHRDDLADNGVLYPRSPGRINHKRLWRSAMPQEQEITPFGREGDGRRRPRMPPDRERFVEDLAAEVEAAGRDGMEACLLANEHQWSRLAQGNAGPAIEVLHDMLAPLFDDVTVVVNLRPQVDLVVSNASQRARSGRAVTRSVLLRAQVSDDNPFFNYDATVTRWQEVFGHDNVRIVAFRRRPDTRRAMIEHLGMDADAWPPPERTNTALGWLHMAVANAAIAADVQTPDLDDLPDGPPLQIGPDLAREIQARFESSNARLVARHPDLDPGDLDPDWSRYDAPSNLDLLAVAADVLVPVLHATRNSHVDVAALRAQVTDLEAALEEAHRESAALQEQLVEIQRQSAERLEELGRTTAEQAGRIEALETSRSWRMTRPLRRLARRLAGRSVMP